MGVLNEGRRGGDIKKGKYKLKIWMNEEWLKSIKRSS